MARLALIPVWLVVLLLAGGAAGEPSIRVRIREAVDEVRLAGDSLRVDGRPLYRPAVAAAAGPGQVSIAGVQRAGQVAVEGNGGVLVDGEWFPGRVALLPRDDRGFDVVNAVPLERYVAGSVAGEIYADWPREALKAQAVIARTYALYERARRAGEPFHVEASVISQRYRAGDLPLPVREATHSTRGSYLSFEGQPILAAYHSSSGGRTASAAEVWGEALPYLPSVSSPDDGAPDYFWSFEIGEGDLLAALAEHGLTSARSPEVAILERSPSGRVARLRIGEAQLSGRDLRQILGGAAIRSTLFDVRVGEGRVLFLGSGSGHGVGLSQWGALELARAGKAYDEILAHYYPGSALVHGVLDGAAERTLEGSR